MQCWNKDYDICVKGLYNANDNYGAFALFIGSRKA